MNVGSYLKQQITGVRHCIFKNSHPQVILMNDIRLEIIVKTEVNLEFKPVSSWLNKHQNNNAKKTPSNSCEPKHIT